MAASIEVSGRAGAELARLSRIGFLTLDAYSMIALTNALEVCRMANYVSGAKAYAWDIVTLDGAPAMASNGLSLAPTLRLGEAAGADLILVCGGIDVRHAVDAQLRQALRRIARQGVALGALCTGAFALAEAGLLTGYRCAIHWENLNPIREEFPDIAFVEDLFVVDRDRLTCTGGTAPLDLMLALVKARLGGGIAAKISDQFIIERMRGAGDRQTMPIWQRAGHGHPVLSRALALMGAHVEAPLAIDVIATTAGVSRRQLERLAKQHLGLRPVELYTALRLDRARELLRLTAMPITEVSLACGYQSAAHFSTAYARRFNKPPGRERKTLNEGLRMVASLPGP